MCVGLRYTGSVENYTTSEKWAIWVPDSNFESWSENTGLVGEDDKDNWFVEDDETDFTGTFTFYRWLPVEKVDYRYYDNEFRWYKGQSVVNYIYYSSDTTSWVLNDLTGGDANNNIILTGAMDLVSTTFAVALGIVGLTLL